MIKQNENHNVVRENGSHVEMPTTVGFIPESLVQILWRNRLIVLVTTLAALIAVLIYLIKATPIYTTTSKIYVEQSGPKIINELEEGIMTKSKNYLYTQAELLKSMPILSPVLEVPGIRQMETFTEVRNHVGYLKGTLNISVGKKDDIISVSLDSPRPAEATQIVNAIVDSYISYHASRKRSTSAEVLKILQNENTKHNKELSKKLKAMMDFKKENVALAFESQQGNIILRRLERLSDVLTEAQLETIDNKSAYESTKEMVSDPNRLKQFVEAQLAKGGYSSIDSERAGLKSKLEQLQLRRADRLRQVTLDHPAVEALESEIAHIKAQIADLDTEFAQARLAMAEEQYLVAKEKEDQITDNYEDQRQQAINLNENNALFTFMQSDWEQTKMLCDLLDDRIKEVDVTEDVGALNISVLEVAQLPDKPSKPQKSRYMAIALVMGLMLGSGLALIRDWTDQRLRSAEEVPALLGIPVLGVVPSMFKETNMSARGQKVHLEPNSHAAEAYRAIRTAVYFSVSNGKAKTILVTSPGEGEGKTTLVSNLAIAMAQAGEKVLILDADFRNPMQYRVFEMNGNKGLVSLISRTTTMEKAIQTTGVKGLELLPCRTQLVNSSEVLNSKNFVTLVNNLSDRYDRVIIDSPPVMHVTDAQILAAICDITLLVLREEKTLRKTSQQARYGLLSVGARILGVVVNDARLGRGGLYGCYGGGRT